MLCWICLSSQKGPTGQTSIPACQANVMQPANARPFHAANMHSASTSQHSPHSRLAISADAFPSLLPPQGMTRQGPVSVGVATPPRSTNPPYFCRLKGWGWESTPVRQTDSAVVPAQVTFLASMKGMTEQHPRTRTAPPAHAHETSPIAAALIQRTSLGRIRTPEKAAVHAERMLVAGFQEAIGQPPTSIPALLTISACPPLFVRAPLSTSWHGAESGVLSLDHNTTSNCYCFECFGPLPSPGAMYCSNCKELVSDRQQCDKPAAYPLLIAGLQGVTDREPPNMPASASIADAAHPNASTMDDILKEVSIFKGFYFAPVLVPRFPPKVHQEVYFRFESQNISRMSAVLCTKARLGVK